MSVKTITKKTHRPMQVKVARLSNRQQGPVLFAKREPESKFGKFVTETLRKDVFALALEILIESLVLQHILPKVESDMSIYQRRAINAMFQVAIAKANHYLIKHHANPYHPLLASRVVNCRQEYPLVQTSDGIVFDDDDKVTVATRRVTSKGSLFGLINIFGVAGLIVFVRAMINLASEADCDPSSSEEWNNIFYGILTIFLSHGIDAIIHFIDAKFCPTDLIAENDDHYEALLVIENNINYTNSHDDSGNEDDDHVEHENDDAQNTIRPHSASF